MKFDKLNLFAAWVLLPHILAMGWVAFAGRMLLELAGVSTHEEAIPGRLVGLLLVIGVVAVLQIMRGSLGPNGNPAGKGFQTGHRLLLAANVLAALLLCFEVTRPFFTDHNTIVLTGGFTDAFGYWVMAMWAISFSLIYQSALPQSVKANPQEGQAGTK